MKRIVILIVALATTACVNTPQPSATTPTVSDHAERDESRTRLCDRRPQWSLH